MGKYDALKIENQLCFPLYACSKEIVRRYKPFLEALDLTYTQYITMLVFWEYGEMNVKDLGHKLFLDSGTLTPLLKKLEAKGYIERYRRESDERNVVTCVTEKGMALRDEAVKVPMQMGECLKISADEAAILYKTLYQILDHMEE